MSRYATQLEQQIRSQPEQLERVLTSGSVKAQVHAAAEALHRVRRIWVVGTGTSQHAANLGAAMLQDAGRSAHSVSSMQFVKNAPIVGPQDGVVVITHTGETAYALAARALAFSAGLQTVTICREGSPFNDAIQTVEKERILTIVGAGHTSVTAREGALKVREAARVLAEGYDAEFFLHGTAVPLNSQDHLLALTTPDDDGLVEGVARAAEAEGIGVSRLQEPSPLPGVLAQIPLVARLHLLALRFATTRGQDPDTVITGHWDDPKLWSIGSPVAERPAAPTA